MLVVKARDAAGSYNRITTMSLRNPPVPCHSTKSESVIGNVQL